MKVKDVLNQHEEIINMAENLHAKHPEDIVQNIWIKLLAIEEEEGSIDRYDFEGKLDYYKIQGMVRNELKKERKQVNTLNVDDLLDKLGTDPFLDKREPDLEEAINILSEEDKDIFYRYAVNKDTQKEISDDLGVSQQLVSKQISKIKKILLLKMHFFSKNI